MAKRDRPHLVVADLYSAPTGQTSEEFDAEATAEGFLVVWTEGARQVRRRIRRYFPHTVTSVGCRVESQRASHSALDVPSAFRNARARFTPRSRR